MDAPVREFIVQIKPSLADFEFREHDLLAVRRHALADFYGAESLLVKPDCFCRIAYNQMRRDGMDCRFRMFPCRLFIRASPLPSSMGWRGSLRAASGL